MKQFIASALALIFLTTSAMAQSARSRNNPARQKHNTVTVRTDKQVKRNVNRAGHLNNGDNGDKNNSKGRGDKNNH